MKVKRLSDGATLPKGAHTTDAGFDLFAAERGVIAPASWKPIRTGIALEIPTGYEGQIRSRSGLAHDHGVVVMNSPGTIDAGYRGEVMVLLHNLSNSPFQVRKGMRIAQLVVAQCVSAHFSEQEILGPSDRGSSGLGSTGA